MERQLRRQIRDPVNVQELAHDLNRIWNPTCDIKAANEHNDDTLIAQKEDTLAVSLVTLILQAVNFMTS